MTSDDGETPPPASAGRPPPARREATRHGLRDGRSLERAGKAAWNLVGLILLAWAALYVVGLISTVALATVVGVFITALLYPAVRRLRRHGMNRALSTVVVWAGGLALFAGLVALLVPPTTAGLGELSTSFGQVVDDLHRMAGALGLDDRRLQELTREAQTYLNEQWSRIANGAIAGAKTVGEIVVGLIIALILSIYFVHGGDRLFNWLVDLCPPSTRPRLHDMGTTTFDVIGRYVRGIAIVGAVDAFFIGMALWILGVPIALPLAVLTFVGAFLPVVGAFMAGLLAAVVAFVAKGWLVALIVVAVTILVQQVEGHVLAPQVYGRALDLPGAVILVAIAIGSVIAGIAGAFLAAPVTAVIVTLTRRGAQPELEPVPRE
ncbi:AI-2E family transporter [Spongiactinospora sp. TRM90649]|uniref:AI-2E family transporter n=1 Tax=Spongiactinospora sp. TRM90649 TaxID=3031114 RepID=UPI0023F8EF38|nr:AI-2E family transporter [Spongiactinospora sp. TRM90649]MDF5752742.1 AI-2E family transporter [Spongiactinospora sp. TRM90649]